MFKKMPSFASFIVCALSLGCPVKGGLPVYRIPVYPDKDLKEIKVYGKYSSVGKEGFAYSRYREYCYNETDEEGKNLIFNKNLRARLYDIEGNMLSEDFLRWDGRSIPRLQSVISYLPYHDEGYKIHVVQLKGKTEVILRDIRTPTQSRLRELSHVQNHITEREGWVYNEERECHIAAFD